MKTFSSYRIGELEVQVASQSIARNGNGSPIYLRAKTFQVLLYLLEHRDRLVTKQELFEELWGDVVVSDSSLVQCIIDLRKALGDDARNPRFIRTISKAGYQFIGPAEEVAGNGSAPGIPQKAPNRKPFIAIVAVAAVAFLILAAVWMQPKTLNPPLTLPSVAGNMPLAVMYFENQSGSHEFDWLREGLADMLITNLSRYPKTTVLSRGELYSLMQRTGRAAGAPLRLEDAMLLAQKSHAEVVVLGEFAKFGDKIRINAHLHDAHTGRLLASEGVTAERPDQIISEVDLLCLKLGARLGSPWNVRDHSAVLSTLMTDNLQAYQYYSQGVEKARAFHSKEAIALFEKAIALDPRFAMAHARIGYTYAVTWIFADKGKAYLETAFRLSDRLTERDRLYISAWYAQASLDYSSAIRKYRDLLAAYPREIEAYVHLGALLGREQRYDDAIATLIQGLAVDRESAVLYDQLAGMNLAQGKYEEAIALERQAVALSPNESNAFDSLGGTYLRAGRYAEAEQSYREALCLKPDFDIASRHLAILYYRTGRYREAIRAFEAHARIAPSREERADSYANIAWCWKRRGNLPRAMDALNRALPDHLYKPADLVLLALWRGDLGRAEKSSALLGKEPVWTARGGPPPVRRLFSYVLGELFLARNHADQAVAEFRESLRHLPGGADLDDFDDCLGDALLRLGRLDEAIAEYERVLRLHPGTPLARYHLAAAYAAKGQRDKAAAQSKQFLDLWKQADADLEEVRKAKDFLRTSGV